MKQTIFCGGMAQLGARLTGSQKVRSSILLVSTKSENPDPLGSDFVFYLVNFLIIYILDIKVLCDYCSAALLCSL